MKIIAKNRKEFDRAETFIKTLKIDEKLIDTIEFKDLLGHFEIITFKNFQDEMKISIPKSWGFWKVYTIEKNEGSVIMTHINVLCKGMSLIYPNSSNKL